MFAVRLFLIATLSLFLAGCSFVATSQSPFFSEGDFVRPIWEGIYVSDSGEKVEAHGVGNVLHLRLVERNGKVSSFTAGIVATSVPSFGIMQVISPRNGQAVYLPVRLVGGEVMLITAPQRSHVDFDGLFIRHGFQQENGTWQHVSNFDKTTLTNFYVDAIAAIANDPVWQTDGYPSAYAWVVFRKQAQ